LSAPDAAGAGQYRAPAGLLEKLLAAVRPEFRADELSFDPADPVFGGAICRVAGCPRTARGGRGLCSGHHDRWTAEGKPDLDVFVAVTSPRLAQAVPAGLLPGSWLPARRPFPEAVHAS
jgi:hypothetical protein